MAVMGNVDGLKVRDRERGGKRGDGEGSHLATASGPEALPSDGDGGSLGQQPCCRDGKAFALGVMCKLPRGSCGPHPCPAPTELHLHQTGGTRLQIPAPTQPSGFCTEVRRVSLPGIAFCSSSFLEAASLFPSSIHPSVYPITCPFA